MLVRSKHPGPDADWDVGGLLTSQHCQERPGAARRGCPRACGPWARRFRGSPWDARAQALVQFWDFATQALPSGSLGVLIY